MERVNEEARARRARVREMLAAEKSMQEIADALGVSKSRAGQLALAARAEVELATLKEITEGSR